MAIDRVVVYQNTSVISDDILVQRLGLIPFIADAKQFLNKEEGADYDKTNSLKF